MSRKSKRKEQKPQSNIGNWLKKIDIELPIHLREDRPDRQGLIIDIYE